MIDRTHPLSGVQQCQLRKLARSTAYYQPTPVSEPTLALMRRIDELYLQYPFAGARMLRDLLRQEGRAVGRRQVATLMRRMGIEALIGNRLTVGGFRPSRSTLPPAQPGDLTFQSGLGRRYQTVFLKRQIVTDWRLATWRTVPRRSWPIRILR